MSKPAQTPLPYDVTNVLRHSKGLCKGYGRKHTHTHTYTNTHTHTCTCCSLPKLGHVGLPGRGERASKGILERWLYWLLNRPMAEPPWNPQNSGWTWKWSHLWAHHTSVSGRGQVAEKGLTESGYPSRDPTAVTPAPSEGNTCYWCGWLNQSGSDISFTSTIDYTRVNLARSSPWLTGMYTSNRKYMNPATNKGGRYNITPSSSRACWQQTQHNQA